VIWKNVPGYFCHSDHRLSMCPCLSAPFTFGHIMRILGRNKFYVKDTLTIEKIAKLNTIVFDKTGTITHRKKSNIKYEGSEIKILIYKISKLY
jgi:cation transport ATPase